jgi:predicted MFS family arabinose efflux permease
MTDLLNKRLALATVVLTAGVVTVGAQAFVLAPLLPDIAAGLATGPVEVGRAIAAYGIGIVASALLLGRLIDTVARRTALTAGMALIAVAAAGSAVAPHWIVLASAQLAGGVGVGVVLPSTYALASDLAEPGAEARATGRVLTGWSIALVAGVPLATVLGDAIGWRAAFGALAVLCAVQSALYLTLPPVRPVPVDGSRLTAALRAPAVVPLLVAVVAFMAAFYGVFAFVGVELRLVHGGGAATAGVFTLCYGVGFGLGSLVDRLIDRLGSARLLAPALGALAVVYLELAGAMGSWTGVLATALAWGFVNHVGLTLLVSRLAAAAPALRGSVMALNSAATYAGAGVAGLLAGPLYEHAGFTTLTMTAALTVALAIPAAMRSRIP